MNIGFLASHNGSNMQSVIDACRSGFLEATPSIVISNNRKSGALEKAKQESIPHLCLNGFTHPDINSLDQAIFSALKTHNVDVVVLVGYMKKLGPKTLTPFKGRILNIHPSLLPKHGGQGMYGMNVHEAVITSGEKESGITIHLVDADYDTGAILAQTKVDVMTDDTAESLAQRVLQEEHTFLPKVLKRIQEGDIFLTDEI